VTNGTKHFKGGENQWRKMKKNGKKRKVRKKRKKNGDFI
jgi:hypothetical protein